MKSTAYPASQLIFMLTNSAGIAISGGWADKAGVLGVEGSVAFANSMDTYMANHSSTGKISQMPLEAYNQYPHDYLRDQSRAEYDKSAIKHFLHFNFGLEPGDNLYAPVWQWFDEQIKAGSSVGEISHLALTILGNLTPGNPLYTLKTSFEARWATAEAFSLISGFKWAPNMPGAAYKFLNPDQVAVMEQTVPRSTDVLSTPNAMTPLGVFLGADAFADGVLKHIYTNTTPTNNDYYYNRQLTTLSGVRYEAFNEFDVSQGKTVRFFLPPETISGTSYVVDTTTGFDGSNGMEHRLNVQTNAVNITLNYNPSYQQLYRDIMSLSWESKKNAADTDVVFKGKSNGAWIWDADANIKSVTFEVMPLTTNVPNDWLPFVNLPSAIGGGYNMVTSGSVQTIQLSQNLPPMPEGLQTISAFPQIDGTGLIPARYQLKVDMAWTPKVQSIGGSPYDDVIQVVLDASPNFSDTTTMVVSNGGHDLVAIMGHASEYRQGANLTPLHIYVDQFGNRVSDMIDYYKETPASYTSPEYEASAGGKTVETILFDWAKGGDLYFHMGYFGDLKELQRITHVYNLFEDGINFYGQKTVMSHLRLDLGSNKTLEDLPKWSIADFARVQAHVYEKPFMQAQPEDWEIASRALEVMEKNQLTLIDMGNNNSMIVYNSTAGDTGYGWDRGDGAIVLNGVTADTSKWLPGFFGLV